MAKTNLGKVGLTPKKAYSADTTYERLDFVTAGDSSYVSLQDNNLGHPVTDEAWWQVLASGAASTAAAEDARQAAANANTAAEAAAPVIEEIEGATVTIDVQPNHIYKCGELTSLNIQSVVDSAQIAEVIFTSGATATELSLPDTLADVTGWQIPQANKTYKIFFQSNTATISY